VVMAGGCSSSFYSGWGGGTPGRGRGKRPAIIALMPLMVGRLDEGLRSEIKRGIKAWSEYLAGHLEVGGRVAQGGRRRREKVATVG
jgi:hypothetical protein